MVQAKHKKAAKAKRRESVKNHGKRPDLTQFFSQIDALALKVIEVTSDGNCFFRALADQLEGDAEEHRKYRHMVVEYIKNHREEFEPFIEDDVPFDKYCKSMDEDGTWAGNVELQAASLLTQSNICIHRLSSPRWYIRNFASHGARMLHLSYHDGEHYNSIRLKEDTCDGPAKRIVIKVDADVAKASDQAKAMSKQPKENSHENNVDRKSVKIVMSGSGCGNYSKAEKILKEVDGDVDAAIEYLIAEQRMNEDACTNDDLSSSHGITHEHENRRANGSENRSISNTTSEQDNDLVTKHDKQEVIRRKKPPQESKKKQKMVVPATTTKRSQAASKMNKKSNVGKGKKHRADAKTGAASEVHVSGHDEKKLPDVGALCI